MVIDKKNMAEKFTNFMAIATSGTEKQIVPYANSASNNTSMIGTAASQGYNTRTVGSTLIVNGLYITSIVTNVACNISLLIRDVDYPSRPIYVVQNINVPINTSFFLDKPITLTTSQGLFMNMPIGLNPVNTTMHASASCIEIA